MIKHGRATSGVNEASLLLLLQYNATQLLNLFSLDKYINAYIVHQIVRDMEFFTQTVAQDAADALGCEVTATAELAYNMIAQRHRIVVIAQVS